MRVIFAVLALLHIIAVPCLGQAHTPDARRVRLGADTLAIYTIRGTDTTLTGVIVDELALMSEGDRQVLVRTYISRDRFRGTSTDTLTDEFPSLAPVRHHGWHENGGAQLDYRAGRVRGFLYLADGDSVAVDHPVPPPIINSSSFDLALRASALAPDWAAEFPAFLSHSRSVTTLRARVAGVEEIRGMACWPVDAEFAGLPVTFWIERQSRRLCQQVMVIRPDLRVLFTAPQAIRGSKRAT